MSDDLRDEIEALNSIYGDGTLCPALSEPPCSNIFILQLPSGDATVESTEREDHDASSLRIRFPPSYPESSAPEVLGTEHASGGRRGAGERDFRLFRAAVEESWQAGAVCLFDAVEDFTRRLEEEKAAEAAEADEREGERVAQKPEADDEAQQMEEMLAKMETPPWTTSEVVVDMKSTFIAHVAPVTSPDQASLYIAHLLASDKRIRTATHNMTAWRIRTSDGTTHQDSDDDGETAAGARMLHLMQLMGLWDAVVVVTRWYGGVKLGPRRFAVINAVARDGFVKAGMVAEKGDGGKKKGK
ncbi:RWD domain-containing protein [Sarocladium implicatum]|nr:RWD domain-containing protein [Sarocladium implicatum]